MNQGKRKILRIFIIELENNFNKEYIPNIRNLFKLDESKIKKKNLNIFKRHYYLWL